MTDMPVSQGLRAVEPSSRNGAREPIPTRTTGALGLGAVAVGALALGATAIGALAIGSLAVGAFAPVRNEFYGDRTGYVERQARPSISVRLSPSPRASRRSHGN